MLSAIQRTTNVHTIDMATRRAKIGSGTSLSFLRSNMVIAPASAPPGRQLHHFAVGVDGSAGDNRGLHASGKLLTRPWRIEGLAETFLRVVEPGFVRIEEADIRGGAVGERAGGKLEEVGGFAGHQVD